MATVVKPKVETKPFDFTKGVRTPGSMAEIMTININDMVEHLSADNFKLVSNAEGTRFLHLENAASKQYFTIKVGKKVTSARRGAELVRDLVENHTVYTGETENGIWFTFGPEPGTNEPIVEVTLADLLKTGAKFYTN